MRSSLKFLLVCEGPTDVAFFKELGEQFGRDRNCVIQIEEISPQRDATSGGWPPHGWTAVKDWCEHWRVKSDEEIAACPSPFAPILKRRNWKNLMQSSSADGLIIQMDTDIAEKINNEPDLIENRRVYCEKAMLRWLKDNKASQQGIYLLLPSYATETWILATHSPTDPVFSDLSMPFDYESVSDVEQRLLALGYRRKTEKGRKRLAKKYNLYRTYGDRVYQYSETVQNRCREAALFFQFLAREVQGGN